MRVRFLNGEGWEREVGSWNSEDGSLQKVGDITMTSTETVVWGVHAGKTGDADALFLKKNRVAIGWVAAGNIGEVPKDRDAFKARVTQTYPTDKPGSWPVWAGVLYRFVHEMKPGDYVVYPSKGDRHVHIGVIEGAYEYNPQLESGYPNQRAVRWLKAVPRTSFTQGALYEIGSALSLFLVKSYADEFIAAAEGTAAPPLPPGPEDETVGAVAEVIEQSTRDFVLKTLSKSLKGHPFADFVAHLLNTMDYRTRVSPPGPDGGIDIVAHRDELGLEPPIIKVQVKATGSNIGEPVVAALYGQTSQSEYGLIVTLGGFTNQAISFAKGKSNLRLIGGEELVDLVLEHYEEFDSRYKALLPLKRVYVPQPLNEDA